MRGHVEASAEGAGVSGGSEALAAAQARIAELEAATAALEQQQRVQAALYRIAETANAARDLQDFYASIHEIVSGLTYGENFYIALFDREREMISFPYFRDSVDEGTPDPDEWEPFGIGNASGLTAFVLRTGLPQHVPDERFQRLVAEGEVAEVGAGGEDWLGVPIRSGDETLGVLVVQTYEPGQFYTDEDVRVLAFVGQHVGSALSSARASAEVHQRVAELAIVNEVGQALARQLDFQSIMEAVGRRAAEALGADGLSIAMLDPEIGKARFLYWLNAGVRRTELEGTVLDDVLTARILESGSQSGRICRGGRRHRCTVQGRRHPVVPRGADPGRRPSNRRDRDRHGRPACLWRRARAPALHAGDEHGCRPRQRPAVRGDEAPPRGGRRSGSRARDGQSHRQRARSPARSRLIDRARRRADAQRVPRGHRVRRTARRDDADDRVPVLQRGRSSRAAAAAPTRRRTHLAHSPGPRAAGAQLRRAVRTDRDAGHRDAGQVLAGRPDPGRRRGDRCRQRAELHRGGPVRDDDARLLATLAASVGVAIQNARLVRARQESEERYRLLVEELPLAIYTDLPGRGLGVGVRQPGTRGHVRLPDRELDEGGFFNSRSSIPTTGTGSSMRCDTNLVGPTQRTSYEYRIVHADGRDVWVRDDTWIVRDADGNPPVRAGVHARHHDQTLAAAEIRRQKQYFESLVEISPVAIVTMDRGEIVSAWNPAATRLFGYQPDEAIGRHIDELLFAPSERSLGQRPHERPTRRAGPISSGGGGARTARASTSRSSSSR